MAKQKFTISFSVTEDLFERSKDLFPEGRTQEVLTALLDAYENQSTSLVNLQDNSYRDIVETLCTTYEVNPPDILEFIADRDRMYRELEDDNKTQKENYRRSDTANGLLVDRNNELEAQLKCMSAPIGWEAVKTTLQPFTVDLLELTANRLSDKYKRRVEPMQILVDMFMRYTLERWNEWFYPFVLKDHEIIKLANQINPEITTISHVKKLFSK